MIRSHWQHISNKETPILCWMDNLRTAYTCPSDAWDALWWRWPLLGTRFRNLFAPGEALPFLTAPDCGTCAPSDVSLPLRAKYIVGDSTVSVWPARDGVDVSATASLLAAARPFKKEAPTVSLRLSCRLGCEERATPRSGCKDDLRSSLSRVSLLPECPTT